MSNIGITELIFLVVPVIGSYYLAYRIGKTKGKLEEKEKQEEKQLKKY